MRSFTVRSMQATTDNGATYGNNVVPLCDDALMLPIADTDYARHVENWMTGGPPTRLAAALSKHEQSTWSGGLTGGIDESLAEFNDREWRIAELLARQGHNVIALPPRQILGVRSPDASVSRVLAEFKTYCGLDAGRLHDRVGEALRQSDRVVIHAEALHDSVVVRDVLGFVTDSAYRCGLRAVMVIGVDFQYEWGDWNVRLTRSHRRSPGRSRRWSNGRNARRKVDEHRWAAPG